MIHIILGLFCIVVVWINYVLYPRLYRTRNLSPDSFPVYSALATVLSLVAAFWSVWIALETLNDAREGAKEQGEVLKRQQYALERSRMALSAVQSNLEEQQAILNENLILSKKQLSTITRQWIDEQKRLSMRPKLTVEYAYMMPKGESSLFREKESSGGVYSLKWLNLGQIDDSTRSFSLKIIIKNTGSLNAENVKLTANHSDSNMYIWGGVPDSYPIGLNGAVTQLVESRKTGLGGKFEYSTGSIHFDNLPTYKTTGSEVVVRLVVRCGERMTGKTATINLNVYGQNAQVHNLPIRFTIEKKR